MVVKVVVVVVVVVVVIVVVAVSVVGIAAVVVAALAAAWLQRLKEGVGRAVGPGEQRGTAPRMPAAHRLTAKPSGNMMLEKFQGREFQRAHHHCSTDSSQHRGS